MTADVKMFLKYIGKMTNADDLFEIREAVLDRLDAIGAYGDDEDYDLPETDDDLDDMLDDDDLDDMLDDDEG